MKKNNILHHFLLNIPPKGVKMNGLDQLLSTSSMRKGVIILIIILACLVFIYFNIKQKESFVPIIKLRYNNMNRQIRLYMDNHITSLGHKLNIVLKKFGLK